MRQPYRSLLDPITFYGAFGLLLFGPVAFGATEPWSIFLLEAGSALLFLMWIIRQAQAGEVMVSSSPLFAPMLSFMALVGLQLLGGHTAYRYQTLRSALLYVSYGATAFIVVQSLRRTSKVKSLTILFSAYGFVVATLALVQSLSSTSKLYWLRTPRSGGWIYGPYVNHNHYAGLMEMLAPIPLVFALTRGARGPRKAMAAIAAALMASTIFLSGSRGGMLALAAQLAVFAAAVTWRERAHKQAVAIGIFVLVGLGLIAWLGGGE